MNMYRYAMAFFVALGLSAIAHWRTDLFSRSKIDVPLLDQPDSISALDFEWPLRFRYLGKGRQCFAFESRDGRFVLKFFDRTNLDQPWQRFLPFSFAKKEREMRRWEDKVRIYPESYRLALEKMPEETGLIVVHQGISSIRYPTIEIIDKASRHFFIDLNRVPFVLQKKGSGKLLSHLSHAQSPLEFENMIEQFLAFHMKRISLCIADGDRDIKRNYSWKGETLLYIDPARFSLEKKMKEGRRFEREWWGCTYRLRSWIAKNRPDKLEYFDRRVEQCKRKTAL